MGLIEKRMIKSGQEEWVPAAEKTLAELSGAAVVYDVQWSTFESDAEALRNVQNQGMGRINAAFRVVCRDELGKEAVQQQVKRVVVSNLDDATQKGITLEAGELRVRCAYGKGGDGYYNEVEIQRILEKLL